MRLKIYIKYIIVVFVAAVIFVGCTFKEIETFSNDSETKSIVDSIGREVIIPVNPQRVACLYTNTGHIMTMLGAGDKIVAVSNGLKRDKLLHVIQPSIADAKLVKLGGDVNVEELLKLEIDLILIPSDMYQDNAFIKQLNKYKIPIIVTKFESISDQQELVTLLGNVFNAEDEAVLYNKLYDDIITQVTTTLQNVKQEEQPLVYHSLNEATNTVSKDSLPAEWMKISKGIEVSIQDDLMKNEEKFFASIEQIVSWNPEYIFCNEDGVDEYIMEKDQWSMIDAVRSNRVYIMPTGISRWGHTTSIETPLAILWTAKVLYPEICKNIDLEAYTNQFYSELFEYELSKEEYDSIIAGRGMRLEKNLEDKE